MNKGKMIDAGFTKAPRQHKKGKKTIKQGYDRIENKNKSRVYI
jgi:hypothetical protein